jgi:hypothetical protein
LLLLAWLTKWQLMQPGSFLMGSTKAIKIGLIWLTESGFAKKRAMTRIDIESSLDLS